MKDIKRCENVTGKRYGKLVAIEIDINARSTRTVWKCKCDCGNITYVSLSDLKNGKTKSCGCLRAEFLRTGVAQKAKARKWRERQGFILK
ncbi:MAG TPA: hypothetical protein VK190_03625 [Pseudoneobacillus sp.]|nr:hypothetical protein [Pseudoneobacillus sp.]